jgi:hypothetical protein
LTLRGKGELLQRHVHLRYHCASVSGRQALIWFFGWRRNTLTKERCAQSTTTNYNLRFLPAFSTLAPLALAIQGLSRLGLFCQKMLGRLFPGILPTSFGIEHCARFEPQVFVRLLVLVLLLQFLI